MPPTIRTPVPVPSTNLLRFLRSQTEASIFSQSHCTEAAAAALRSSTVRSAQNHQCFARKPARSGTRPISTTTCGRPELVRASLIRPQPVTTRLNRRRKGLELSPVAFFTTTSARQYACDDDSSTPRRTWKDRLWGIGGRGVAKPLKPNDLPFHDDGEAGSMFNNRRILTAKAALEPRLRCTEVDENGEVILVDGEFKKTELIAKVRLHEPPTASGFLEKLTREYYSTACCLAICERSTPPTFHTFLSDSRPSS